jgi:molybdate transport system substrate-binding protein
VGTAAAVALAACSSTPATTAAAPGTSAAAKPSGSLVVFAATSLTDAFDKIGAQFEKANPCVHVKFNYNGSSSLATQITQGAPADVFASTRDARGGHQAEAQQA